MIVSNAKKKLAALAQVEAAPAPAADPLDRLAARANSKQPDDPDECKFRCTHQFKMTLKKLAARTGYNMNGLMQLLLEIGVEELEARIKAGKGATP